MHTGGSVVIAVAASALPMHPAARFLPPQICGLLGVRGTEVTSWDAVKTVLLLSIIVAAMFAALQIWLLRDTKSGSKWIAILVAALVAVAGGVAISIAPFNKPHMSLAFLGLDPSGSLLVQATFVVAVVVTLLVFLGREQL